MSNTEHLDKHGDQYRVRIFVPRHLRHIIGRNYLKQPLHTGDLKEANRRKGAVVTAFKAQIAEAESMVSHRDADVRIAMELAATLRRLPSARTKEGVAYETAEHAERLARKPGPTLNGDRFYAIATGRETPIETHHQEYMRSLTVSQPILWDEKRGMKLLLEWCKKEGIMPTVQAITPRVANHYATELPEFTGLNPNTARKYVNRLSIYFRWLIQNEFAESNPWADVRVKKQEEAWDTLERPFTDAEVSQLLRGTNDPNMLDLMKIGALTGARLDAIVSLDVGDIVQHQGITCFKFKPMKKERKPRLVPVHSSLSAIVAARILDRAPEAPFFACWPDKTDYQPSSKPASDAFAIYRRKVGVDEMLPGKRRSLVNFHSWRRWAVTKMEQAGQPESIIAAVVGHKKGRESLTLGLYSAGPLVAQAQACVEAIELPL